MRIIKKKKFWQKSISLLLIVVLLLQTVVPLVYADSREEEWRGAWDQEHPGQEPPEGEYERHVVRDDAKQTGEDISEEEVWERAGGDDDDESSGPSAPAGAPTTSADTSGHYENLQWHIAHGTAEKDASGNWVVTDQSWERAWELTGGKNPDFRAYNEDPEAYREQYPDIATDIDRYYDNNQPGAGTAQDIAVVGAWGTPISEEASNHCQGFTGADRSNCEQIVQHAIDSGEPWYRYCGESGGQCINFDSSHWEAAVQTGLEINQHQVVEAELAASGQEIDPLYRQAAIDYLLYGQRTSEGQYRPATVPEIRTQFASLDTQIKTLRAVVDEALFGGSETEVAKQYGDVAQDVVASLIRQGITGGETLDRAASELKAQMVEAAKKAEIGGPSLEGAAGVSGPMVEPKDKTYYEVKGTGHLTFEYQNKIYAIGINKDGKIDIQGSVLTLTLKEASAADFKFWFENGVPEELLSNFAAADQKYRETLITQKQNEYAQIWAGFQYFQGKSAKPADAPNLGLTSPPEDKKEGLAFRQWLDGQANSASVKEAVSYYQNLAVESGVEGLFRYSKEARAEELYGKSFDEAFEELKNEYGEAVAKATEPAFSLQSAYLAISEGTTVQVGKKPEEVLATRGTGGMMALTTSPTVAEPEVGFGRLAAIAEEIEMEKLRQKMVEPTVVAKPPEKAAPVGESGFAKIFRQKVEEIEVPPAPLKREIASGITLDNPEYYLQAADEKEARDYLKEAEEIAAKIRQEVEAAIIQKDGEITAIVEPRADSIPEIIGSLFVGKEKAVGPTEQRSVHYRLMADGTLYLTYKGELYSFPGESPARKPVYPFFRPAGVPAVIPPAETVEPPAEAQPSGLAGLIGRVGGFFSGLFRREKTPSLEPSLFASPEEMVGPRNVNIDVNYFDQKRAGLPEKIPVGQEFKISGYTFEGKKIEASCVTTPEGCEADLPPGKYDVEGEFVQYRGKAKITVPVPERGGEKLPDYNLALNPKAKGEKEINTLQGSIVIVAEEQVRQPEMPVVEIVAEGKDGRTFQPDYIASLIGGNYEISLPDGEYVLRARVVDPLAKADDPKRILEESPRNFRVIDGILKECDEGWRDCQIPKDTSDIFDVKLEQKGDQVAIVSPPKAAGSGLVGAVHLVAEELSSVAKTGGQSVTQVGNQVSNLTQRVIGGVAGKLFPKKGTPPSGTAAEWRLIEEEERKKAGKTAAIIRERGSSLDLTSTQMQAWATTAFEELATTYDASLEELKINRGGLSLQIGRVNVADTNDPTQKAYWEYREVQEDNEAFYGNLGLTGQYIYEAPYAQAAQPVIQRFKDQQLLLKAIETTNEACGRLKDNCGGQPIHSYDNPETDLTQDQRDLLTVFLMAFSRNEDAKVADAITNIGVMGGQAAGSAYVVAQSGGTLGPLVLANILMSPAGGFTFSLQDQRTLDTFNRLMAAKYGGFVFNSQEAPPNVAVLDEKAYKELFPFSVEEERERLRWELWVRYKEDMSPGMPYRRFIDGQVSNEQYQKQLEVLVEKEVNSRVARQTYENDVVFGDKVIHHLPSAEIEKDYRRTVEKMKSVVNPEENQSFLEVDVEVVDPMVLASYRLLVYDESSSYYGQAPSLKTADGREYLAWGPRRQEDRLATLAFIENLNKLLPEEKRIDPTKTDQIVNMVKLQAALEEYEEFVIGTPLGEQRAETEQTATTSFLTGMAVDALFSNFVDVGTAVVGRFFKVGTLAAKTKYLFGEEVAQEALEKMPVEEGGTLVVRVAKTVVKKGQEEVEEKFIPIAAKGINLGTTVGELLDEARRTTRIPLENVAFRYLNPQASRLVDEGVRDTAWRILPVGGDWLPNIFKPLPEGPEELLAGIPGGVVGRLEEITGKEVASELASRETAIESLKAEMRGARETGEEAAAVLRRGEPAVLPQMDEGIEAAIQATTREAEEAVPPSAWQRFTTGARRLLRREPEGITAPRPPKPEIKIKPFSEVPRIEVDPASLTRPVVSESTEGIGSGKVVYRVTMEIGGEEKAIAVHTYSGGAAMDFGGVINGAQVLDETGVGARFLGIADLGDGRQAFLTEIIEGDVPEAVPKWISDQTIEDVEQGLRLLREEGFDFRDPQYMVTPAGRAVFMDPDTVVKLDPNIKLPSFTPVLTDARIEEELARLQALRGGAQSESFLSRVVNLPHRLAGRGESVVLEDLIPADREVFVRYIDPQGRGRVEDFVDRTMTAALRNYDPHVGVADVGGTIQILDGDVLQTYRIADAVGNLNFTSEVQIGETSIRSQAGDFFAGLGESLGLVGRREAGEVAEEAVETGAVISQAKFISNPDSIPQGGKKIRLDPEAVRRYGLAPTVETSVGEVNFYLSKPFKMDPGDGERLAAIVYVETSEGIHSRPVVQSASQGVWRAVSHTDGYGFFGKGLGENSLALPFEVQDALNKLSREEILDLKNSEALGVFYGLLEKSSREYIPSESPFLAQTAIRNVDSLMGGNVRFVDKRGAIFESKVVDGKRLYRLVSVPEGSADIQIFYSPELSRSFFDEWTILFRTHNDTPESKLFIEPSSFQFRSDKAPRKFIGATGELDVCPRGLCKGRGYVFLSEDETIRYLFGRDEATGKLFLMAGEAIYTPINTYGIRTSGLDLGDLAMPLYEYYDQFPTKYIGDALPGSGYFDVSAYIDEFPFIQEVRRVIDNLPSEAPALETKMIRVIEEAAPVPVGIFDRVGNFFRGIRESLGITGRRTALPVIDEGVIEPLRKITTVDSQLAGREGQILASLRASLPEDFWQRVNQIHITPGRSRSVFIPSGKDEQGLVYDLYVAATGSFDQSALKRAVAGAVTDYHYTFSGLGETKGLIEVASQRAERSVGGFYADVTAAIVTGNEEELGRLASQGGLSSADIQILRKHTTDVFSGINLDYIQPVSPLERGINFFRNLPSLIQNVLRLSFGSGGSVLAAQTGTEEVNREEVGRAFQSQLGQLDPDQAVVFSPAFYAALKQRLALFEAFAEKNVEKMTEEEVLAVLQEVAEKDLEVRAKIEEKEGRLIMTTGLEGRVSGLVLKGLYRLKAAEIKGIEISMPAEIELTSLDESATLKVGLSSKKKAGWQAIWQKLVKTARAQSLDFESLVAWSSPEAERPVKIPAEKTWLQVELYRDENENGYYDPGEPPVQWAGVKIELESLSRQEEYHLLAGWNLVAFPFQPGSIKTASQLVRDIANQGGHVTIVAYYENGKWQEYVQRGDKYYGLNFRIDPGRAYFLLNHQETKWQVAGLPLEEPLKLTLKAGWNGIGLPDSALTAAELIRKVNEIGCPPQKCEMTPGYENADVVARWYSGLWDVLMQKIILKEGIDTESRSEADRVGSDNYGIDTYGTDFAIESTRGYLLRLKSPVEWAVTK